MEEKSRETSDRISFELPLVPHALRAFIEKAVQDDHFLLAFVESPGTALRAAGVPIQMDCLNRSDCMRLADVIGNLRGLVSSGRVARDFRFEDVFPIGPDVFYQEERSTSQTYAKWNFDHSTEGQSSENKSHTEGGIKEDFNSSKKGLGLPDVEDIFAPLINPSDLAVIATLMQNKMKMMAG